MNSNEPAAKTATPKRRTFATLAALLRPSGSGAPSSRRPHIVLLASALTAFIALALLSSAALAATPAVTLVEPAANVQYTTAHLEGQVNPEDHETFYRFEYITEAQFLANVGAGEPPFASATETAIESLPENAGLTPVGADLTGLAPETAYEFRLVASNESGPNFASSGAPFHTKGPIAAPLVEEVQAEEVLYTTATAKSEVTAGNSDPGFNSPCFFQWIPDHTYEENIANSLEPFEGASGEGCNVEPTGAGPTAVQAHLTGLAPSTEYHLRLVASNQGGTTSEEAASTFTTKPVAKPAVSIEAPSLVNASTETYFFAGHVNPNAPKPESELQGTEPEEEAIKAAFATHWAFSCEPGCPAAEGDLSADNTSHLIEAEPEGLQPNTVYTVALHASNAGGEETASRTFKTPAAPPGLATGTNTPDPENGAHEVLIRDYVNRRNSTIASCRIEYGTTTSYGQEVPCHGRDEVQQLTIEASGGTFALTFQGQSSADIPFNASPAEVRSALEALPAIGPDAVRVQEALGGPAGSRLYKLTFTGALSETDVPQIQAASGATPLQGTASAETLAQGAGAVPLLNEGPGNEPQQLDTTLAGLAPATLYHYRILASGPAGTSLSEDAIFETLESESAEPCANAARRTEQHSTYLGECRAYEQVSPPDKNGNDIPADTGRDRAAADGSAIVLDALGGFGDARGMGVTSDFMAVRGTEGWATHGITPPQQPVTPYGVAQGLDPVYVGELSPDLARGVFRAFSPIPGAAGDDSGVAKVENLYLRDDLRSPGAGSYRLLSPCPLCVEAHTEFEPISEAAQPPRFADASSDFSHLIFESRYQLLPEAPANSKPKLYESDQGTLSLAGLIPPSGQPECGPGGPACEVAPTSQAGQGALNNQYTQHTISADGSRVFFTIPQGCSGRCGALYLRENGRRTVQINLPQGGSGAGTPSAKFWTASADGSRAFFTTEQRLTPDDTDSAPDVYMYEAEAPAGHHLTRISASHNPAEAPGGTSGVIGASEDGRYVYFIEAGQLLPGQPEVGGGGIYEWHDGALSYVGKLVDVADVVTNVPDNSNIAPLISRVAPDGRHLLFFSRVGRGLAGYDQGKCGFRACSELYLYSAASQRLQCASCSPAGTPPLTEATDVARYSTGASSTNSHINHALSADGRYVFFSTGEPLVARDTNGKTDAYSYDAATGAVRLLSSGTSPDPSYFIDASANGSNAFFDTRQPLVGWDPDSLYDIYDARVGGGFPEPPPAPEICAGSDTCHAVAPPPPAASTPASESLTAPANPQPPRPCPKGKVRKSGHCVKRNTKPAKNHKHHKRTNKRHAKVNRGASK